MFLFYGVGPQQVNYLHQFKLVFRLVWGFKRSFLAPKSHFVFGWILHFWGQKRRNKPFSTPILGVNYLIK